MGITLELVEGSGLVIARVSGVATRVDHLVAMDKARVLAESGGLLALLVDGRDVDVPRETSFTKEMWEDVMAVVGPRPVAYVPPPSFTPAKEAVIRRAAMEWGCDVTIHATPDSATAWCLAQMAG